MQPRSVVHDTFVIERHFAKPAEKVFSVLADPVKRRSWFAEGDGHEVEEFKTDFRVGGTEVLRYRFTADAPAPVAGRTLTNEIRFEDIVPNRRVVTASTMTLGDARISVSLVTLELLPHGTGTELVCTHQGTFFEGAGDPKMREAGWNKLLDQIAGMLTQQP